MFHKSILTIATATMVTIATFGVTTSMASATQIAVLDLQRNLVQARVTRSKQQDRRIRVINPRCNKYLIKFQRTGDEYYMRLFRRCVRQPL